MFEVNCKETSPRKRVGLPWFPSSPIPVLFTCLGPDTNLIANPHIDKHIARVLLSQEELLSANNYWALASARHGFTCFTCVKWFDSHNNPMKLCIMNILIFWWGNWGARMSSDSPKVTQWVHGGAGVWTQAIRRPSSHEATQLVFQANL